ncbi:hypothetical protein SAMN05444678_11828 [Sphingomonas sp. YR710]|uniref:hypothetical protein n=1 Tax=Sphingomonas sp. YR710 TaxID=1882773 RepID=UPI00088AC3BF|nr:hypothetical protein [Sphingomonas sp. YR710]SDD65086.1 hypothetical protein SAMN05444678_11828 [Sphingomonas sp. YR710]
MNTGIRLLGGSTSLIVNALFLMLLIQAAPDPYCTKNCLHATYFSLNNGIGDRPFAGLQSYDHFAESSYYPNRSGWMPFIDIAETAGSLSEAASNISPSCRAKYPIPALQLIEAPLPKGLPIIVPLNSRKKDTRIFLCVQVDLDGRVRQTYLPHSTGDISRDEHLLHLVTARWRFAKVDHMTEPSWVRMRLDSTNAGIPEPGYIPRMMLKM